MALDAEDAPRDESLWGPAPDADAVNEALVANQAYIAALDRVRAEWPGGDLTLGMWLATPHRALAGRRPFDLLSDDADQVVSLARSIGA